MLPSFLFLSSCLYLNLSSLDICSKLWFSPWTEGQRQGFPVYYSSALGLRKCKKKTCTFQRRSLEPLYTIGSRSFLPVCPSSVEITRNVMGKRKATLWLGTKGALNRLQLRSVFFFPDARGTLHNSSKNKCTAFGLHYRSNYQWTQRQMGAEGVRKRKEGSKRPLMSFLSTVLTNLFGFWSGERKS